MLQRLPLFAVPSSCHLLPYSVHPLGDVDTSETRTKHKQTTALHDIDEVAGSAAVLPPLRPRTNSKGTAKSPAAAAVGLSPHEVCSHSRARAGNGESGTNTTSDPGNTAPFTLSLLHQPPRGTRMPPTARPQSQRQRVYLPAEVKGTGTGGIGCCTCTHIRPLPARARLARHLPPRERTQRKRVRLASLTRPYRRLVPRYRTARLYVVHLALPALHYPAPSSRLTKKPAFRSLSSRPHSALRTRSAEHRASSTPTEVSGAAVLAHPRHWSRELHSRVRRCLLLRLPHLPPPACRLASRAHPQQMDGAASASHSPRATPRLQEASPPHRTSHMHVAGAGRESGGVVRMYMDNVIARLVVARGESGGVGFAGLARIDGGHAHDGMSWVAWGGGSAVGRKPSDAIKGGAAPRGAVHGVGCDGRAADPTYPQSIRESVSRTPEETDGRRGRQTLTGAVHQNTFLLRAGSARRVAQECHGVCACVSFTTERGVHSGGSHYVASPSSCPGNDGMRVSNDVEERVLAPTRGSVGRVRVKLDLWIQRKLGEREGRGVDEGGTTAK
ncbi:hypothetical protein B0H11DRAFT_1939383 [Mycena galericulata]|nr:hypothetical protein B0H11DRAFT_1939383 [Mycena galericulata]